MERYGTCERDTDRDSISVKESPGWNCMMSASSCLVLQEEGVMGERGEGPGKGLDVGLAWELTVSGPRLASWLPGTQGGRRARGSV